MAVFSINGREAESLDEAFEICRQEWTAAKAPAVREQLKGILTRPTPLDIKRAQLGIAPIAEVEVPVEVEATPPKKWWKR